MAKSKIKSIEFKSEWANPKGGVVYYHEIEFENGDNGQIGTKEKNSLKVGDEFEYTLTATDKGNKIKREMSTFGKAYNKVANDQSRETGMMVGASINCTTTLFAHGKITKEQFEATAEWLCNLSLRLKDKFSQ